MTLKYNDFYILINIINSIPFKSNKYLSKIMLFKYFHLFFKYNIFRQNFFVNDINNLNINFFILNYLYKFYNTHMEILLIKYNIKKYFKMYLYLNFFNFFFKFLNWYYNFLCHNKNIIILDTNLLLINNYSLNLANLKLFINVINMYNCRFIVNLDSHISKDFLKLFYEFDFYCLDLSIMFDHKYNKNNFLQLLFYIRNLVLLTKFFNNI